MIPAKKQKMAVRVPDGNIAQKHPIPVIRNSMRNFLILVVMARMRNAVAEAAILMPKHAASLKMEKYLMRVPPCRMWVLRPRVCIQLFSDAVKPKVFCFHTQKTANKESKAQTIRYLTRFSGVVI